MQQVSTALEQIQVGFILFLCFWGREVKLGSLAGSGEQIPGYRGIAQGQEQGSVPPKVNKNGKKGTKTY